MPKITQAGSAITASDGIYTIKYEFARKEILLTLQQTSAARATFVTFCSTSLAYLENISESTALPVMATVPSDHDWTDVKVSTAGGEYLQLRHGSRTWGNALGCQVWESAISRRIKSIRCSFIPGVDVPRQPTLDQLTVLTASFMTPDNHALPDHLVAAGNSAIWT